MAKTAEKKKARGESGVRKFKLLPDAGSHFEPNTDFDPTLPDDEENPRDVEYGPGEVVTSRRPLDKLFVNKFRKVGGDEEDDRPSFAGGQVPRDPEYDPDKDRPVRSTEMATRREAGRFIEEEELEGKKNAAELLKQVRGEGAKKKSVLDDEEDDEEEVPNDADDDTEDDAEVEAGEDQDESDEDEAPARRRANVTKKKSAKKSKK
jgi:hypothetical protein